MECISLTRAVQTEALRGIGIYRWQGGEKKKRGSTSFTEQPFFFCLIFITTKKTEVDEKVLLGREKPRFSSALLLKNSSNHGEKVWFPFQIVTHRRQRSGQNMSDHSFCWGQFQLHIHFHHRYVVSAKCFPSILHVCTNLWLASRKNQCLLNVDISFFLYLMPSTVQTGFSVSCLN